MRTSDQRKSKLRERNDREMQRGSKIAKQGQRKEEKVHMLKVWKTQ